nr:MAG TPA: hypothetical protein [Caudoviricetes sp.]
MYFPPFLNHKKISILLITINSVLTIDITCFELLFYFF